MAETRKLAAILAADVVGYSPAVEASAAFDLSYAVLSWYSGTYLCVLHSFRPLH